MKQVTALAVMKAGNNVFLTGEAGAGKSHTLRQFITEMTAAKKKIALCASTGIASTNIGGTTIHSWSGIGIKDELSDEEIAKILLRHGVKEKFVNTHILIIDEISMLHPRQFNMIDRILRKARNSDRAFGGMQVIACGDFFQLPPIEKNNYGDDLTAARRNEKFCFMADAWGDADFKVCYLTEQHRAAGELSDILNAIRKDTLTDEQRQSLRDTFDAKLGEGFTRLYTHNVNVNELNDRELAKIESEAFTYNHTLSGRNQKAMDALMKSVLAENEIVLKVGAKVMFVKNNFDAGYVNGTQGTVVGFTKPTADNPEPEPIVEKLEGGKIVVSRASWKIEEDDVTIAEYQQIPLRLAWAITIHKSQGMTLDAAEIDLIRTFADGQGYVALSRLRDIKGLRLIGMSDSALNLNRICRIADARFKELSSIVEANFTVAPVAETAQQDVLKI